MTTRIVLIPDTPEEWRSHPEHVGVEASTLGGIRSYLKQGARGGLRDEPHLLNPSLDQDGYQRVSVRCADGKRRRRGVHQIVAETYLSDSWFAGAIVLHGPDTNRAHNAVTNLRWGTWAENAADRAVHGTLGLTRSADEIREIKRLYQMGFYQREIARVFKTSQCYVHDVISGKKRKDVA